MLNKALFTLFALAAGAVILTGAWPGSVAPSAKKPPSAFLPQNVPLDPDVIGSSSSPKEFLDKACAALSVERTTWLKTTIRQTMTDAASTFVAEGFLQRGPDQCAHLEMEITANGQRAKLLIVSDGGVIATVKKLPHTTAEVVVTHLLPEGDATSTDDRAVKENNLNDTGCGGPAVLLEQLRQHLQDPRLQTGLLDGKPVIQIKGELNAVKLPAFASTSTPIRFAAIYLDAKTLWPHQIEWWGEQHAGQPILQIEFRDPELNRELSLEDCVRLFSYRPEGVLGTAEEQ